ncbi:MAG: GlxA family transcriptional regulator [Gulosibacter sp.]|uniref:GlxA family transcriptional regulator n=1 Tax=Gulosibacter sp. TaxID=2817531 RepID=UPI003F8EE831
MLPTASDMMHRVGIYVFDGMTVLDASGPAEVFSLANSGDKHYELSYLSHTGGTVRSASGIAIAGTQSVLEVDSLDTLLVVGGEHLAGLRFEESILEDVATLASIAHRVTSVCTGAFILAELGLLDGRRATTHWRHASELARRYPRINVEPDVIHIRDGNLMTSAGITAGIDLALAMVEEDLGATAARTIARELVMFMQRPGGQSQFSTALQRRPIHHDALRSVVETVAADPADNHTITSMAASIGVSTRHLNRIFHAELGMTPSKWLEEVRADAASALILDGHPVTRAAQLSGFGSDESLRRAFARHFGTTPSAFRDRFATTRRT